MLLQPNFNVSRFVTLGFVLLLLLAMVDMGPIAYSEEVEQKPSGTFFRVGCTVWRGLSTLIVRLNFS